MHHVFVNREIPKPKISKKWIPHPGDPRLNSDGSSPTKVLETMRNLIVELQVFKADNEKLKKAQ
jgi:hypothetical protein